MPSLFPWRPTVAPPQPTIISAPDTTHILHDDVNDAHSTASILTASSTQLSGPASLVQHIPTTKNALRGPLLQCVTEQNLAFKVKIALEQLKEDHDSGILALAVRELIKFLKPFDRMLRFLRERHRLRDFRKGSNQGDPKEVRRYLKVPFADVNEMQDCARIVVYTTNPRGEGAGGLWSYMRMASRSRVA